MLEDSLCAIVESVTEIVIEHCLEQDVKEKGFDQQNHHQHDICL